MKDFVQSRPVRFMALALALVTGGGGLSTLVASGPATLILQASLFASITLGLIGIGWFLTEDPGYAGLTVAVFPLKMFFVVPVTLYIVTMAPQYGWVLCLVGLAQAAFALRPSGQLALPRLAGGVEARHSEAPAR